MTDTKTNDDLRDKILFPLHCHIEEGGLEMYIPYEKAKEALDEYWEKKAKELLEWMAKNDVECYDLDTDGDEIEGGAYFKMLGNRYTTKELFENFL